MERVLLEGVLCISLGLGAVAHPEQTSCAAVSLNPAGAQFLNTALALYERISCAAREGDLQRG